MSLNFRYDISFLRSISVISVLLYHFKFSYFKGGFIGVDIFFVISGYLMTKIILSGFFLHKFNLIYFYKRRVIRIFPALLAMIVFFALVVFFLLPTQLLFYFKSAFSSSLFFSNIYYFFNSGYFDQASQYNFLLHTWSLSVEWQFYLIYPLLLLVLKELYLNSIVKFKIIFYALILVSAIAMLIHNLYDSSFSFYMFYTRAWEMMLGGTAFLNENAFKNISKKSKRGILIFLYIILIYFILTINEHENVWPSLITVVPVVCTTLIIILNYDSMVYKNKLIKYIGDISYSLYLYHWPFYVISMFFALENRIRYKLFFILFSIIFSIISFHFIEKRNYNNKVRYVISSSIVIFIISFLFTKTDANYYSNIGNLINITANYKYSSEAKEQYNLGTGHFLQTQKFEDFNKESLMIKENNKLNVILLGDSHAGMFSKTVNNILKKNNINYIQVTANATYPMINAKGRFEEPIEFFNYFFTTYFPNNYKKIKLVIISSNYVAYRKEELIKNIDFTENYFNKYNIKVLYLGQTDNYVIDFPTYYYLKNTYGVNFNNEVRKEKNLIEINNFLKKRLGSKYIDLMNYKIDKISGNNVPYIYDSNHLTFYGTEQYRSLIESEILKEISVFSRK